ncbi:alpha/beta-hydrolase [Rhypophila decipiens]|uniref:Carboxylic ester hydrolase n=1 Tax=Rhypophila decipiens TaxID=261697 RepID=A0AAN6XYE4_9PEZI|nr:alpha/beta-hydrolase [Rhypophila decipiens]
MPTPPAITTTTAQVTTTAAPNPNLPPITPGRLQQVTGFGSNPTNTEMFIYVPSRLAANPAVVVALHPCGGSAQQFYSSFNLPSFADSNGFIVIYAQTRAYSNCWDVNNAGSLTHGGSGDATGIVSMVSYTLNRFNGNKDQVFVMGASSGAMMTNVMVGSYPDVFEAGAAYSGTAFACFAGSLGAPTPMGSNQTCAQGLSHPPQKWADYVRNAYPGYTGKRPRMQVIHGLGDTLVRPQCGYEQLKQWSAVLGLTNTNNATNSPMGSQYTQINYGDGSKLVGYFGQGVGHYAPPNAQVMLKFFGII